MHAFALVHGGCVYVHSRERHLFQASLEKAEAAEAAKQEKAKQKRLANRQELLEQMEENARRAKVAAMSETERSFNRDYLARVNDYLSETGKPTFPI